MLQEGASGANGPDEWSLEKIQGVVCLDFLKEAINDYKELFLSPLQNKGLGNSRSSFSATTGEQPRYSRHSNLKVNKEVVTLKSENEEKHELKDLAKFVTQLTQGYFGKFE